MKPSLLKGTRDFGPEEVFKRNYIFDTIKDVFEQYAYQPLETPAMEKLQTLTGKYGDEGDQLLFKILNNGDFAGKVADQIWNSKNSDQLLSQLSKRGLRYDLTVPFARYVVMNHHALDFPFKRYQIQPVWRADRPQKGRFQEFFQCDVDVVGSDSLMHEAELVQIYDQVFTRLKVPAKIIVNHRKILEGITETAGVKDQFVSVVTILDKLDKVGKEKVIELMVSNGLRESTARKIIEWVHVDNLEELAQVFEGNSKIGLEGIEDLRKLHKYIDQYKFGSSQLLFDPSLARGLSYYTGCVFEVKVDEVSIGSIGGGGRYDNLTETFGLKDMSGVGVSFGADRIYMVMEEMELFPEQVVKTVDVFLLALDQESYWFAYDLLLELREGDVRVDMYPNVGKMKKMMKYANNINAPHVIIIGESEREKNIFSVKNMKSGDQKEVERAKLLAYFIE